MAEDMPICTGEVEVREDSPSSVEATWTVKGFHHLQMDNSVTAEFRLAEFASIVQMDENEPGYVRLCVTCYCSHPKDPRVDCQVLLKSKESTLLNIPIREEEYHVTKDGTILFCKIPWTEIVDRKEDFFPAKVLTVIFRLRPNPPRVSHGRLQIISDSPSVVKSTWSVDNFFALPCKRGEGVLSEDIPFPGGKAFLCLHPYGTDEKRDLIRLTVAYQCPVGRGMRNPELDCEVALKADDGSLYSSLVDEDDEYLGDGAGFFCRYFKWSEVFHRRKSILPGGVLTACIQLSSREGGAGETESLDSDSVSESEEEPQNELKSTIVKLVHSELHHDMAEDMPICTGEVEVREDSPSSVEATWTVKGFHHLQRGDSVTTEFRFAEFDCFVEMDEREPDYVRLCVTCYCPHPEDPRVDCRVLLKSKEATLLNIPIREEEYHVTQEGTILFCKIPWTEIVDGKEEFFPAKVLTVIFRLRQDTTRAPTQGPNPPRASHGRLQIISDSPSVVKITWSVDNFFTLPRKLGKGVLSEDIPFPGGEAFLCLHPYGTYEKRDLIRLTVHYECPVGRGLRNPELDCEVALKADDGSLYSSLVDEDEERLGDGSGFFAPYFKWSEVFHRRKSILPGGVLTACIRLSSREGGAGETESLNSDSVSESEE